MSPLTRVGHYRGLPKKEIIQIVTIRHLNYIINQTFIKMPIIIVFLYLAFAATLRETRLLSFFRKNLKPELVKTNYPTCT